MSPSAFHLFSSLPCELRQQIWRLAIRPSGGKNGIHHFKVLYKGESIDGEAARVECTRSRAHITAVRPKDVFESSPPASTSNASVYLWDAGLWTTCKESRDVIMCHFQVQKWSEKRQDLKRSRTVLRPVSWRREIWLGLPSISTMQRDDGEWHLMVRPFRDLFCFEPTDWKSPQDWVGFFHDLPFSSHPMGLPPVGHIGIEFNPSWNENLPEDVSGLLLERSARGFVANAVMALAEDFNAGELDCSIWLIDRRIRWRKRAKGDEPKVWYDCDQEFVEVKHDAVVYSTLEEFEKTALYFIRQLGALGNGLYTNLAWPCGVSDYGFSWRAEDNIHILGCRESQLEGRIASMAPKT
ncbi:hypothetical protein ACJZ2D_010547 [Fusarium nematophilum]